MVLDWCFCKRHGLEYCHACWCDCRTLNNMNIEEVVEGCESFSEDEKAEILEEIGHVCKSVCIAECMLIRTALVRIDNLFAWPRSPNWCDTIAAVRPLDIYTNLIDLNKIIRIPFLPII